MLECRILGVRCRFSLLFPALLTTLLLLQPEGMAISCLLASVIHELGHLLAMMLLKCLPKQCVLGAFGMRLEIGDRQAGYRSNVAVSLAGPLVNLACAAGLWMLSRPEQGAIHLLLCLFNLLPVSGLDGGEVLRCLLSLRWEPHRVERGLRLFSVGILTVLTVVALWLIMTGQGNGTLFIVCGYLFLLPMTAK